jgi:D-glycero-alpha-D-manno-heptose-7-phosphate kinase
MLVTRTPYRLSFFGGGTDYAAWYEENEGLVIASAMDHHCYITMRRLPPFFPHKSRVVWSQIETVSDHKDIQHPSVKGCLKYLRVSDGLEIHHDGDLPARSGIGSSSSFTVGMLNALHALNNRMVTTENLARQAIEVEHVHLEESVGVQDQIMAAFGGLRVIRLGPGSQWQVQPLLLPPDYLENLEQHVLLGFTGVTRIANNHAEAKIRNIQSGKSTEQLIEIQEVAADALKLLADNADFDQLGALLHRSWQAKRQLTDSVTNDSMDEIYATGMGAGAFGGKLMGAGGGGFFFFIAPPRRHEAIRAALPQVKVWVPFRIDSHGSQVIYHGPE